MLITNLGCMLKNGQNLLDHETQKSVVSHKLFDQLSRLTE